MTKNKYLSLFLIILITSLASAIGGFTTTSFKEPWYSEIILPSFNPPSWVFAPVWTTLYIMMSIAIWKIWINSFDIKILKLYFIHLFFNGTWSVVFFGFHQIGLALINLIIILIFIVLLMKSYLTRDKISFYLMIPYLLWSSYALILNSSIFLYN
ncbi:tryptophan-rich sensory protein [Pelagibacteraceae bacterium]|jgi:translocator protein|nr:tryptophan-rich sensory protein [Pelagibacteraceae bacterium]|tara:strand:+ start:163 stop:627 length:465 start_codon:yes stop_codon:yes gene_type:complete